MASENVPLFHPRSMRLYILLLMALCVYCGTWMRSNLGVAIVCMINHTHSIQEELLLTSGGGEHDQPTPPLLTDDTIKLWGCLRQRRRGLLEGANESVNDDGYDGTLDWSPMQQSQLFSALFYGSLLTIGVSGWLADRYSPKSLLLLAIASYSLLNVVSPSVATDSHYYLFWGMRFMMGLSDGLLYPCLASMVARWFPPAERSSVAAVYTSGNQVASTLGVLISTRLCALHWDWPATGGGWANIFYVCGLSGMAWSLLWWRFAASSPLDPGANVGEREINYLKKKMSTVRLNGEPALATRKLTTASVPWVAMLTSTATASVFLCQFSFNFCNTLMQNFIPTFLRDVLLLDLKSNGLYTATPYLAALVSKNIAGLASDYLKRKGYLTATAACRLLQTLSAVGASSTLLVLALFVDCANYRYALPLLAVFGFFFSGSIAGAFTSSLLIAPQFTGTITSLSMVWGTLGNLAVTNIVGLLNRSSTRVEWRTIFIIAASVHLSSGAFFLLFGSGDVQPWADDQPKKEEGKGKGKGEKNRVHSVSIICNSDTGPAH